MECVATDNQGETIMATTTTSKKINDITEGFGDAAERYRVINEKLVETGKKTANAALEGYEKTVASYVDFRQQVAEATQLDWLSTVVKAQNDFLTEVNAAYVSAARDALK
jgi:esterase/lipase